MLGVIDFVRGYLVSFGNSDFLLVERGCVSCFVCRVSYIVTKSFICNS